MPSRVLPGRGTGGTCIPAWPFTRLVNRSRHRAFFLARSVHRTGYSPPLSFRTDCSPIRSIARTWTNWRTRPDVLHSSSTHSPKRSRRGPWYRAIGWRSARIGEFHDTLIVLHEPKSIRYYARVFARVACVFLCLRALKLKATPSHVCRSAPHSIDAPHYGAALSAEAMELP